VATELERQRDARAVSLEREAQASRRRGQIAEFWAWAPGWMEITGNDEEELLKRFPSYRGTKPGE
jgi:hypothetical protein